MAFTSCEAVLKMPAEVPEDFLVKNKFSVRPNTGEGLWVFFLLPLSLIIATIRHPIILTPTYKLVTLISFTLLCNSLYIIAKCIRNERLKAISGWSIGIAVATGCLYNICLHKGWMVSFTSSIFVTVVFLQIYSFLLTNLPQSFTLGEAGLISQGFAIFIYSIGHNILHFSSKNVPKSNMQISTLIIQVGLLGILSLAYLIYKFNIRTPKTFYFTTFVVLTSIIIIPLHMILDESPVLWIFGQILGDIPLLKLFIYWSFCTALAVLAVSNQIFYAQKASTSTRKIFHILAVLVYVPGLYYRCSFLYLSSGIVLGVFIALEILRLLSMPPVGNQLQEGYIVFSDDKDTGLLALTPIYLLVGVSLPIWIHPAPCDVTDSAQFSILPLISGLLSIGVGDTSASYIGSNFGKLRWKGTTKTIEGTLACIFSQLGFVYFLYYLGCLPYLNAEHLLRILVSILLSSVIEAKTTQIDNLVLPLVMFLILI